MLPVESRESKHELQFDLLLHVFVVKPSFNDTPSTSNNSKSKKNLRPML